MEAALQAFADCGFSGTSISDIAVAAKVPKSLVQYHFGSKEELWQSCIAYRAAPMFAAFDRFLAGEATLEETLMARIRLHEEHPQVCRLLAWLSMEQLPTPAFVQIRAAAVQERITQSAEKNGLGRALYVLAAIDGWFLYRNLYRKLVGDQILQPAASAGLSELVQTMMGAK